MGFLILAVLGSGAWAAGARDESEVLDTLLRRPRPPATPDAPTPPSPSTPFPQLIEPDAPTRRFALGINFMGAQCRWRWRRAWAAELRFQHGEAEGDYGRVMADVFGLRGYRFLRHYRLTTLYLGGEAAYTQAKSDRYSFSVSGPIAGAFGGVEIKVTKNTALGVDIGPYVLALREKQTSVSNTTLDFVVNTGVLWYVF